MREDPEVVVRFAAYYHDLGAEMVYIYNDGPADHLAHIVCPRTKIITCDDAFWDALGGRPEILEDRQGAVFQHGVAQCETEWALLCDGDEFVFGDRPVEQFLDWVPDTVDSVRIRTAEAVWGPGDDPESPFGCTWFRLPWTSVPVWRMLRRVVYGERARFFRHGLLGHVGGKQFLRTGRGYSLIRNHYTEHDGQIISVWAHELGRGGAGMYLGHFDAIGYDRWREKWGRRISRETQTSRMAGTRKAQFDEIAEAMSRGEEATRATFLALYALSPTQARILKVLGYAFQRDLFRLARAEVRRRA